MQAVRIRVVWAIHTHHVGTEVLQYHASERRRSKTGAVRNPRSTPHVTYGHACVAVDATPHYQHHTGAVMPVTTTATHISRTFTPRRGPRPALAAAVAMLATLEMLNDVLGARALDRRHTDVPTLHTRDTVFIGALPKPTNRIDDIGRRIGSRVTWVAII